ncbi:PAS domain-containing protein [Macrophomina phaseolina MS6]|uniref:PAS domain-containing protein n=1 Tax=Macrophomina phaseolina (strain MS6) TaxID=1126212 RepID=K2RHD5_MACPH|nr:PAS domain-containing protein [Macrophomina phaseolina MS6]
MSSLQPFRRFRSKTNSSHGIYSAQADPPSAEASHSTASLSPSMTSIDDGRPSTAFRQGPPAQKHVPAENQPIALDFQDRHQNGNTTLRLPHAADQPQTVIPSTFDMSSDEDEDSSAPPDIGNRNIHIPARTTSREAAKRNFSRPKSQNYSTSFASQRSVPTTPESHERGSGSTAKSSDSIMSYETHATSIGTIPPLQATGEKEILEPLVEDDPANFDLVASTENEVFNIDLSLEKRYEQIISNEHLQAIFSDPALLNKFTSFLSAYRPKSIPLLIYYLDALKALRAINYANAVAEALEPIETLEFTSHPTRPTINTVLEEKSQHAFDQLVRDDLPAYVSHVWVQVVSVSIQMRITGTLPPHLRDTSEGLAETFCLTDPSRKDNPIIFASEEFHRTTQYGVNYAIGRNCRFLQGPRTNKASIERLSQAIQEGKETNELLCNYRRDGSVFINLLMMAPLMDNKGKVRYFIGSQIDVSGLAKECADLPALKRMLARAGELPSEEVESDKEEEKDEFQSLCEMFNQHEIETVRRTGGRMHREQVEEDDAASTFHQPRLLLKDTSPPLGAHSETFGKVKNNVLPARI